MKKQMIQLLHEKNGFVSSKEICDQFGVSRTAVWKMINQLKEDGYQIESVSHKGYRLQEAPDLMTADEIKAARQTSESQLGREIFYYDTIDSTNIKAAQLAEEGYESGLLVVSDEQTAGKGRRGRSWSSKKNTGIFMSLMLKPDIDPNHASMLTLVSALAICDAIEQVLSENGIKDLRPQIKWPNDILLNRRKMVGILTEMSTQIDYINYVVIGIGLNIHNTEFPEEIASTATSFLKETNVHIKRAQLIAHFLDAFEKRYKIFLQMEDLSGLQDDYNARLVNKDNRVRVLDPKGEFEGEALGINSRGELLVEVNSSRQFEADSQANPGRYAKGDSQVNQSPQIVAVSSGEVSVRGIYGYV